MIRDLLVWMCIISTIVVSPVEAQNRAERTAQCLRDGDSETSSKLAKRVVAYAAERWELADWATQEDRDNARGELYDFLKHKLGGPSAICAQYISTGDGHFRRGYSDEAAAAIAGLKLPGDGRKNFAIPRKVAHKLAEEALFGAIWAACTGLEAMPSGNQLDYGRKVKARDVREGPVGPYTNNPSGQTTPSDPTRDPNTNKTALHGDANASPQDMKECEEKARKAARGAADYIITRDIGFDIPSTERYDVKDKLLNALILAYQYRRLDHVARQLMDRAEASYGLNQPTMVAATAVNLPVANAPGTAPVTLTARDQLVSLLYRLYRRENVSPVTILQAGSPFAPEGAAARVGVKFIVDRPETPSDGTDRSGSPHVRVGGSTLDRLAAPPPYALVPAELSTPAVASALAAAGAPGASPGAEILIERRVPFKGTPIATLVSAYKANHGIPESTSRSPRSISAPTKRGK
jgi:hypothetical protein